MADLLAPTKRVSLLVAIWSITPTAKQLPPLDLAAKQRWMQSAFLLDIKYNQPIRSIK
jgi:hypothetical protein